MSVFSWQFAEWRFCETDRRLEGADDVHVLRGKTAKLLAFLLAEYPATATKESILDAVWSGRVVTDNTLMQSVRELRKVLGDDAHSSRFIETVHGVGYRWIGPEARRVQVEEGETPPDSSDVGLIRRFLNAQTLAISSVLLLVLGASFFLGQPSAVIQGDELLRKGHLAKAEQIYLEVLERDETNASALIGLRTVRFEQASSLASPYDVSFLSLIDQSGSPSDRARALALAGDISFDAGDLEAADRYYAASLELPADARTGAMTVSLLQRRSDIAGKEARIADYLLLRTQAAEPQLGAKDREAFSASLMSIGSMVTGSLHTEWGTAQLERALDSYRKAKSLRGEAYAHLSLGRQKSLDAELRREHLEHALAGYERMGHARGRLQVFLALADLSIGELDFEDAVAKAEACLDLTQRIASARMQADCRYRRGLAAMLKPASNGQDRRQTADEAMDHYDGAIAMTSEIGARFDLMAIRLHHAVAQLEGGAAEEAVVTFGELISEYRQLPFPPGGIGARLGMAAAYDELGRHELAVATIEDLVGEDESLSVLVEQLQVGPERSLHPSRTGRLFEVLITAERTLAMSASP